MNYGVFTRILFLGNLFLFIQCLSFPLFAQDFNRGEYTFTYSPVPAFVERRAIPLEWTSDAPGADASTWRNWLADEQLDYRGEQPIRYFEYVVEARNATLIENAARFEVGFNPDYESLYLHSVDVRRAGKWEDRFEPDSVTLVRREGEFEAGMATGRVSALIIVDDVRVGDLVRYAYSVKGENPILRGQTHLEATLGWVDPILSRSVRILFPQDQAVVTRIHGEAPDVSLKKEKDSQTIIWRAENLAAIRLEEDVPNRHFQLPLLEVSTHRDWRNVARWASDLYPPSESLSADLDTRIAEWKSLPDDSARAAAALQAVQEEVRYFSVLMGESTHRPTTPAATWVRRFGDCKDKAWLLTTILEKLGIYAEPVLVSTSRGHAMDGLLPAASQFDHVIVRAIIEGKTYWLDATRTMQRGPLANRQSADFGFALPVRSPLEGIVEMSSVRDLAATQEVYERYLPDPASQVIRFEVKTTLRGIEAEQRRYDFHNRTIDQITKSYADYYRKLHGELTVAEPLRFEDDPESGEIHVFEVYKLTAPWIASSTTDRELELYADALSPALVLEGSLDRRQPLWRRHPLSLRQSMEIVMPDGWLVGNSIQSLDVEDDSFRYQRRRYRQANQLTIVHRYESRATEVPVTGVIRHFEARRQAADSLGVQLQLILPVDSAEESRKQRLRLLLGK